MRRCESRGRRAIISYEKGCLSDFSRSLRLFRIDREALFPDDSDSAEDMVPVSNFKDLPDLFRDGYTSSSNYLCEERYLFFVKFNRHSFAAPPLVRVRETINISGVANTQPLFLD